MISTEIAVNRLTDRQDLEKYAQDGYALVSETSYRQVPPKPKVIRFGMVIHDPNFWIWRGIGSKQDRELVTTEIAHPRKVQQAVTYKAITGRIDPYKLYLTLGERGAIREKSVQELQEGYTLIPHLDQLAVSRLQTSEVMRRVKRGYGVWPVEEGGFGDIDFDKLKVSLSQDQRDFLIRSIQEERKARALWFRGGSVGSLFRPHQDGTDYLPAASEILKVFELFYDQERYYPTSGWFRTSSQIPLSLGEAYRICFVNRDPREVFVDALLERSSYETTIRRYMSTVGDFSANLSSGGVISRKKDVLRVEDGYGYEVFLLSKDDLFLRTRSDSEIQVKANEVTMKNSYGDVNYAGSQDSVLEGIKHLVTETRLFFDQQIPLVVALNSRSHEGVEISFLLKTERAPVWRLLNGGVIINPLKFMEPFLEAQAHRIPFRKEASVPLILPD